MTETPLDRPRAAGQEEAPRPTTQRSPADVLRLVVAAAAVLACVLVEWWFGDTLVAFAADLLRGLDALPTWMIAVVVIGTRILGVVMLGCLVAWALLRRRWRMLGSVLLAGAVGIGLSSLLDSLVDTEPAPVLVDPGVDLGPLTTAGSLSSAGVAAVAGVLTAAAPWLGRRWRRAGWTLTAGLVVTGFVHSPVSFDALAAVSAGWLAGSLVLVAGGAPSRRPTPEAVIDGLAAVGLRVPRLERAGVDARGSTPYFGFAADGSMLFVKVLGADERSADLLFRVYRRLRPRDFGDERPFSTLRRAVEHEAFAAFTAAAVGVRTPALRAFATAAPNGYVLAYEAIEGRSIDRLERSEVTEAMLADVWRLVARLREHRIAHRDLRLANIFVDDIRRAWLIDFGFSEVAASDLLLAADVAELVASSSVYVGSTRAVHHAARTVDVPTLHLAHSRLRGWALSGATRTALKATPGLLDELRDQMSLVLAGPAPAGR